MAIVNLTSGGAPAAFRATPLNLGQEAPAALPVDTSAQSQAAAQAALMGTVAKTISELPGALVGNYVKGKQVGIQVKAQNGVNSILNGTATDKDKAALSGITVSPDGVTYKGPGALSDLETKEKNADIALKTAHADYYGKGGARGGAGANVNPLWESIHSNYTAANPTSIYQQDPNTGAYLARGSSFGGVQDVASGQDDGLFAGGKNGASVLKLDGTPITEADIPDVRAHPEKYKTNPENYAALPSWVYQSGAVKPGEQFQVAYTDGQGNKRWQTVVARDPGPAERTGRGIDVAPHVLKNLGADTDQQLEVYFPRPQALAGVHNAGQGKAVTNEDGAEVVPDGAGNYTLKYANGHEIFVPRGSKNGTPRATNLQGPVKYGKATMELITQTGYQPQPGETEASVAKNAREVLIQAERIPPEVRGQYIQWQQHLFSNPTVKSYLTARHEGDVIESVLGQNGGNISPAQALGAIDAYVKAMRGGAATQGMTHILEEAQPLRERLKLLVGRVTGDSTQNAVLTKEMAADIRKITGRIRDAAQHEVEEMRDGDREVWAQMDVGQKAVDKAYSRILNGQKAPVTSVTFAPGATNAPGGAAPAQGGGAAAAPVNAGGHKLGDPSNPHRVATAEDYANVPMGNFFIDSSGKLKKKGVAPGPGAGSGPIVN